MKQITQMMAKYNSNQQEIKILNNQLITKYCKWFKLNIDYNLSPKFQENWNKETVAMWLTLNQLLIPRQWMHDHNIKDIHDNTLTKNIQNQYLPVPHEYQDEQKMTIFDKAYFGIIPEISNHKSDEQNEDGFTVAMILALNNIDIPECWYHYPSKRNKYNYTVAMYQAKSGRIPDEEWHHNPLTYNKDKDTVAFILIQNKLTPPKEWCYECDFYNFCYITFNQMLNIYKVIPPRYCINMQQNKEQFIQYFIRNQFPIPSEQQEINPTIFDQTMLRQIPDIQNHKPDEQDEDGWTTAMILAFQGINIPKQWNHDCKIQNKFNHTVEDYLIFNNKEIPKEWQTNPDRILNQQEKDYIRKYCKHYDFKDNYNISPYYNINDDQNTIVLYLASKGIVPPKVFMHGIHMKNKDNQSIETILSEHYYIFQDGQFVLNYKVQNIDDTCQICLTQGEQSFIKTICALNHYQKNTVLILVQYVIEKTGLNNQNKQIYLKIISLMTVLLVIPVIVKRFLHFLIMMNTE